MTNWVLLEPAIASARMFFTIGALLYMHRWPAFQMMIAMFFHYFVTTYNGQV